MGGDTWQHEHDRHVADALARGDEHSIKRAYSELGDLLHDAYGDDVTAAPLLSLPETVPVVTHLLNDVRGLLLDAGCGPYPGAAMALAGGGRRFVAVDLGLGTVQLARSRAAVEGVEVLGVVADIERLPFRTGAFAGGLCDDTIEHLPDDAGGVRELARVLAPRARMVLATPNRRSLAVVVQKSRDTARGRRADDRHYYVASSHLREYTWTTFERLVKPWFRVRERASVGWSGGWRASLATVATRVPALRRFSRMIVLVVEPLADGAPQPR